MIDKNTLPMVQLLKYTLYYAKFSE